MLHHLTSKALIKQLKHSLEKDCRELTEWKQKLVLAQKYEDAAAIDDILKKAVDLQLSLTNLLHE